MAQRQTIRINGKTWRISRRLPDRKLHGLCDYTHRVIYLAQGLSRKHLVETAIHEALHAAYPDISEESVTRVAADIARFLRKLDLG